MDEQLSLLITVAVASRQLIYFGSHYLGVNSTYKCKKDKIDDHEAKHRKTEFVVLLHIFLVTFSTDDVDVFTLRSATAEIKPGLAVFHVHEYGEEYNTDEDPKTHGHIVNFVESFWLQIF